MPAYFLVRIAAKEQQKRKEKKGALFLHPNYVYLTRGMQSGQIVAIGETAGQLLPQAQLGDELLFHHFVEAAEKSQCVYQDDEYNYYAVTALYHNGNNNQTYGVYHDGEIIPHPDYLFLACPQPATPSQTPDDYLDQQLQPTTGGILTFKEWKIDREALVEQMKELKARNESLLKSQMTPQIQKAVAENQAEMDKISRQLSEKRHSPYTLLAAHPDFLESIAERFSYPLQQGERVLMLDIACETKLEFQGTEYIVAKAVHFVAPYGWLHQQLSTRSASLVS